MSCKQAANMKKYLLCIMALAGVSLGSNMGDRQAQLKEAAAQMEVAGLRILKYSMIHETNPVGFTSANMFFNQCILAATPHSPLDILEILMRIEQKAGRLRSKGVLSDRPLDLDLLFYDDKIINTERLTLPHPRMHEREFVLRPLQEIYPHWQHPVLGLGIADMLSKSFFTKQM